MISTRTLGSSDIAVSAVGIGCNAFGTRIDQAQTTAVVDAAIEHGVTFFDTADTYGRGRSEELLGAALQGRRDQVVLATKFGMDMGGVNGDDGGRRGSATYVRTAVEASLRRLGTDHIDLYQLHTPDPSTPLEETLGAMTELVVEGKVRVIGSYWQLPERLYDEPDQVTEWARMAHAAAERAALAKRGRARKVAVKKAAKKARKVVKKSPSRRLKPSS